MPVIDLQSWLEEQAAVDRVWLTKRLSANDTGLTNSHQAGPYMPKEFCFAMFPSLADNSRVNPDCFLPTNIASHPFAAEVRVVWYNQKTRDEVRLTRWGGSQSATQDVENTGALAIFSFRKQADKDADQLDIWVCDNIVDEEIIENLLGMVEPGEFKFDYFDKSKEGQFALFTQSIPIGLSCALRREDIPSGWLTSFPSPKDIVYLSKTMRSLEQENMDVRLLKRRQCEFEIFQSVEKESLLPKISGGFSNVDDFLELANSTLQRRKARSGRSLELQLEALLIEEKFLEGCTFDSQKVTEGSAKPDFIFPSQAAYQDASFPSDKLRMLAVKTTAKDRWRQVLVEAERVQTKHLLTLQEGISETQYAEMKRNNLKLVVPGPKIKSYPASYSHELLTIEDFVAELRSL